MWPSFCSDIKGKKETYRIRDDGNIIENLRNVREENRERLVVPPCLFVSHAE